MLILESRGIRVRLGPFGFSFVLQGIRMSEIVEQAMFEILLISSGGTFALSGRGASVSCFMPQGACLGLWRCCPFRAHKPGWLMHHVSFKREMNTDCADWAESVFEKKTFVPHRSVALRRPSLGWG